VRVVKHWNTLPKECSLCGVSVLGDTRNLTGHSPEQPALVALALRRGLDYATFRGPFQLQPFCEQSQEHKL